ncbi:FG-GAP-like repeat-containing protein [Streptomyces melanogenes]|uniref:FG-GAP-like repeat-containing protein n=1 Tax=Streptomyces melanogenes TaxID=67326 RepID=UPI0037AD4D4D
MAGLLGAGTVAAAGAPTAAAAPQPQYRLIYREAVYVNSYLEYTLVTVNADGTGRTVIEPNGPGLPATHNIESPVYSPDGKHLAFIVNDGYGDVWVADPDGSHARPVAMDVQDPDGWVTNLAWGPRSDMLYLGFQLKPGHDRLRLQQVNLDGSGLRYVFQDRANVYETQPSVAPDGTLAFLSGGRVMLYDPRTGGEPTRLTEGYQPAFSPDGSRLAFSRIVGSTGSQLFVRDLASGTETQLTSEPGDRMYPRWSPDGEQLAFLDDPTNPRVAVHSARTAGGPTTMVSRADVMADIPAWVIPPRPRSTGPLHDFTGDGRGDLLARDTTGTLYRYNGTGTGQFATRVRIGGGWNTYNQLVAAGDLNGDGRADLLARDTTGTLYRYDGTGTGQFASRVRIGGGWNAYNLLVPAGDLNGDGRADLLARDGSGVLYRYDGTGTGQFASRLRIGGGWNTYTQLVGAGDLNGDGRADLLARDSSGMLYRYDGTGTGQFAPRARIGGGWNTYNQLTAVADVTGDSRPDAVARDASGTLWLYQGTGITDTPFKTRVKIGGGWNTYNTLF